MSGEDKNLTGRLPDSGIIYIFTGFIGFKAKALEKTADAVCSGAFLFCIRYEYRFVEEDVEAGRVCGCTSLLVQESVIIKTCA